MFIKVFCPFKATINQPGDFSPWHFVSCSSPRAADFRRDLYREIDSNLNTMFIVYDNAPIYYMLAASNFTDTAQSRKRVCVPDPRYTRILLCGYYIGDLGGKTYTCRERMDWKYY